MMLNELGFRIGILRTVSNLSQEKLAEKACLHKNFIGLIENGKTNPSFLTLAKIAKALNTTVSELTNGLVLD